MSVCPICNGKKHIFKKDVGWVRCSCVEELRVNRVMQKSKFPIPLQKVESDSFKLTNPKRNLLGQAMKEEVSSYDKKPFFIFSTSTEKDKVAAIISRYLVKMHSEIESVRYVSLDELTENFFSKEQLDEEIPLKEVEILTISIGKEITNMAHRTILYNLLYDRLLNERFTIVISSIPKMRIRTQYLENVDDLMQSSFKFFEC